MSPWTRKFRLLFTHTHIKVLLRFYAISEERYYIYARRVACYNNNENIQFTNKSVVVNTSLNTLPRRYICLRYFFFFFSRREKKIVLSTEKKRERKKETGGANK